MSKTLKYKGFLIEVLSLDYLVPDSSVLKYRAYSNSMGNYKARTLAELKRILTRVSGK